MPIGSIIKSFTTPGADTRDMAWDGKYLWASNATAPDSILQISPVNGAVVKSIPAPSATPSGLLAFAAGYLLHTDTTTELLYVLYPENGSIIASYSLSFATNPLGLEWDGRYVYISDVNDKIHIISIDNSAIRLVRTISTVGVGDIRGLAYMGNDRMWVVSVSGADEIHEVDMNNGRQIQNFRGPASNDGIYGLAFDGHTLWLGDFENDLIHQVSLS